MCSLFITWILVLAAPATSNGQIATRYVYDAGGQLVQVVQADGSTITYEYDDLGNLTRRLVSRPTDTEGSIISIYPAAVAAATENDVTIYGIGLNTVVGVTFDAAGISATVLGAEATAVALRVRVEGTVAAGPHTFTINRSSLPPLASGNVALNVSAVPVLNELAPSHLLTGQTVDQFTLRGARLDRSPTVVFDRPGLALTNVTSSADGTSLSGRLQVGLDVLPGPVGVRVKTSEGTTKTGMLAVARSTSGLSGSYFADVFTLDGSGLPVVPMTSPTFIRSDAALQFGTSTGFGFRPCLIRSSGCLNGRYTVRWQGYIFLESAGTYTFALNSSDASQLLIGGHPVVSNPGAHTARTMTGVFAAPAPGSYSIVVVFNTSGSTPGIDLLYQPPGATALSPVPGAVLWSDGSVYDPVVTSAAAAVSVSSPATPTAPGSPTASAGATAAVSFANPASTPQPGSAAATNAATSAVSFVNPAAAPAPGETAPSGGANGAVSFANPAPVTEPGASAPVGSTNTTVSFSTPTP